MNCIDCMSANTRVTSTDHIDHKTTWRYVRCLDCGAKFKTEESIQKYKDWRQGKKPMLGKKQSEITKKRKSESMRGRKITWELNATTPEANRKRSQTMQGKPKPMLQCPHCGKEGGAPQMKQWHFDKCKEK